MLGLREAAPVAGMLSESTQRTAAQIEAYLQMLMP